MFVAPLNLDLFFKKVFSNTHIAKRFLENFFGVTITSIKLLAVEKKITDEAVILKFDFRCKINGKFVIIEMQQEYKKDVVKRFYVYHAASTVLQLETLAPFKITSKEGKEYTEKNYSGIEPVITFVWMVHDNLGFSDDFVAFTTLPEPAKSFITDEILWHQSIDKILEERQKVLKILDNKTKGLDFFFKNRLIYAFQRNIIKNKNIETTYFKYFDFANTSQNLNNKEEDFLNLKDDKDMAEIIDRLKKDNWSTEEFKYVSDLHEYDLLLVKKDIDNEKKLERQKRRLEKIALEHQLKAEQEKQKAEQEKQKAEQLQNKLLRLIKILLKQGDSIPSIATILELSVEETTELIKLIQD